MNLFQNIVKNVNVGQISQFSSLDFIKGKKKSLKSNSKDCPKNIPSDIKYTNKSNFIKNLEKVCKECDDNEFKTKYCHKCKNLLITI